MIRHVLFAAAFGFAGASAVAAPVPAYVKDAVVDTARPEADIKRDIDRKPAEMLVFAGIKPGMKVMDVMPGGGYFTRLFAKSVGIKGYVYAYAPSEMAKYDKDAIFAVAKAYPNVSAIRGPIADITAPETLDVVWTAQNYHDLYDPFMGPADVAKFNKGVYAMLKPGGVFVVLDHAGEPGSGIRDTDTLHRIDEAVVKKDLLAAGFVLVAESQVLRHLDDAHVAKVFDASIRGHTDQFILKFQKPGK